jgi:hypothetical protein
MHCLPDLELLRLTALVRHNHVHSLASVATHLRAWLRDDRYTAPALEAGLHETFRSCRKGLESGSSNVIVPLHGHVACRVLKRPFDAADTTLRGELCEEMRHAARVHAAGAGLPLLFFGLVHFPSSGPHFVSCWPLATPAWTYVVGRELGGFAAQALAAMRAMSECVVHLDCHLGNMVVLDGRVFVCDFEAHFAFAVTTDAELAASRRFVPVLMCITQASAAPLDVTVFSRADVAAACGAADPAPALVAAALAACDALPAVAPALVRICCQYVASGLRCAPSADAVARRLRRHALRARGFDALLAAGRAGEYLGAMLRMALALVPDGAGLEAADVNRAVAAFRRAYAGLGRFFAAPRRRAAAAKRPRVLAPRTPSPDLTCHSPAWVLDTPR